MPEPSAELAASTGGKFESASLSQGTNTSEAGDPASRVHSSRLEDVDK